MDDAVPDVEEQVALLLRLADRNRRRSSRLEGTLDRSAYIALRHLTVAGPSGINDLADRLRLDASTVTRQVVAMEADGYVARGRDSTDGRRAVVTATPAGERALAHTRAVRAEVYDEILRRWSPADRRVLADALARLNADLDADLDRAAEDR